MAAIILPHADDVLERRTLDLAALVGDVKVEVILAFCPEDGSMFLDVALDNKTPYNGFQDLTPDQMRAAIILVGMIYAKAEVVDFFPAPDATDRASAVDALLRSLPRTGEDA